MKFATQPNPDHILFEAHGYTVEMCIDEASLLAAMNLRYKAYLNSEAIQENFLQIYEDQYDRQINSRVMAVWKEGEVLATIRNMIYNEAHGMQKTLLTDLHQTDIQKHFEKPITHAEVGRLAISPQVTGRDSRLLQGIVFRSAVSLLNVSKVEYALIGVKPQHVSFYQRMLGFQPFGWEVDSKPFGGFIMETTSPLHCKFTYSSFDFLNLDRGATTSRFQYLNDLYLAKQQGTSFVA